MAIAFDAATGRNTVTGTTLTFSHTVGSGTDRILIVGGLVANTTEFITGITYNGVAMTQGIKKQNTSGDNSWIYLYYLVNPASGAHNVVVSTSSSVSMAFTASSYTGAKQTGQPDATGVYTGATESGDRTVSITTVTDQCWLVATHTSSTAQPVSIVNGVNRSATINDGDIIDSNGGVSIGANTIGYHWNAADSHAIAGLAIAPTPSSTANFFFFM